MRGSIVRWTVIAIAGALLQIPAAASGSITAGGGISPRNAYIQGKALTFRKLVCPGCPLARNELDRDRAASLRDSLEARDEAYVTYGISDAVALDASIGRSEVSPTHGRPIPIETDGRTDLNVGVTWRLMDEPITGGASVAVRAGAILAGDYEAGGPGPVAMMGDASRVGAGPTAIGDGADGFEVSAIVGRIFGDRLALSAELGTRNRTSDVPRENFANLDGHWIVNPRLVLSLGYYIQDSTGDVDIGPPPGPGKHGTYWHLFPEVAEDIERVSVGGSFSLTDRVNVGLHWFQVLDGRNTAEYDAFGGTLTYNFGL